MASISGGFLRTFGPLLREHRIGRDNLKAAFPEKSDAEIETILRGVWDNLGRVAAEFAHIDRLHIEDAANPGPDDIVYTPRTLELFQKLRDDGKPALLFTSHLANWELAAYVAEQYGLHLHVLYRRPNIGAANDAIVKVRAGAMGTLVATGLDAPNRLAGVLQNGGHVAMLVDQYYVRGVDITFFGRRTKANPFLARLARHVDCPIHGARIVRLPGDKFRIDVTEEVPPVRDANGEINVEKTTQAINDVIEGWVREHPEQWLWVHRKWRD
jgi:KDO2-lipid IV(A) lauroyltransferase